VEVEHFISERTHKPNVFKVLRKDVVSNYLSLYDCSWPNVDDPPNFPCDRDPSFWNIDNGRD